MIKLCKLEMRESVMNVCMDACIPITSDEEEEAEAEREGGEGNTNTNNPGPTNNDGQISKTRTDIAHRQRLKSIELVYSIANCIQVSYLLSKQ